ncbi:MAG: protein translocase subunit SecDF [Saprospiraceae bacterium]|nr:protein translocase subunit SecDF [Saprospiraceae bacterium]
MEGKGLIKVFLVLIALVCLMQFWFFIPTNRIENDAHEFAVGIAGADSGAAYKMARTRYLDSLSSETIFSIPLVKKFTYAELKKQQLALGLDLKGGMSTVLEVDLEDFLKSVAGRNSKNPNFVKALEEAKEARKTSQSDLVTLFTDAYRKIAGPNQLNKIFARAEVLGDITNETDDGVIARSLRNKANETVGLTYRMLNERIDRLGVTQPNISLDASRDLILVEMPGIDNPQRARQYLQASAQLEFWDVYRATDAGITQAFVEVDNRLKGSVSADTNNVEMDTMYKEKYDELGNVIDSVLTVVPKNASADSTRGPLLNAITLNSGNLYPTTIALVDKSKKTFVMEILAREDVKTLFPRNSQFMWSYKPQQDESGNLTNNYELYLINGNTEEPAPLDGEVVTSAIQSINPVNGQVEVNLRMNAKGAKKWAEMTTKAAADGNREIAIVLDDEVVSAPRVNEAITGGSSAISGNYTVEEAVDFANILEIGKLPAKTKILQESNVGPSLGKSNIEKSIRSLLSGFALVIFFMVFYYAGGGVVSVIALLLNVFFIFGSLSSFNTVLTLSGIAGIVLTIGMAVDANVIIFERIREELRIGKSLRQAVSDGFSNSYSAIIDANVTTLLTAIILAYFGLGPVKGFAIVLIIGVLSSMFTAIFVVRLIIDWWLDKGKTMSFSTSWSEKLMANLSFDFIGKRRIAYIISGVLILISIISVFTKGFDTGVDFKGGFSYNVQFTGKENVTNETLKEGLKATFGTSPVVKQVDTDNTFNITTSYMINEKGDGVFQQVTAKLHEGIVKISGSQLTLADFENQDSPDNIIHITSATQVGPTIAADLKKSSWYAGTFAILGIFLYILMRFSKWQYSFGAIVALLHDSILTMGAFSIFYGILPFPLEMDQTFIAALLTVLGYSINDTVIIFDRMREFLGLHVSENQDSIINKALNTTLSRTTITSFTTLFVVVMLLLFGGASIKGFAFAIFIGILVGTYSSIFIAAPIMHDLSVKNKNSLS